MKVRDLKNIIYDKVVLYKTVDEFICYKDIYEGEISDNMDLDILEMKVICMGVNTSGMIDIKVE